MFCWAFVIVVGKYKAVEVLQHDRETEDHLVFVLEIFCLLILGDQNPRVVSPPVRILGSDVYAYEYKYNTVLEQLVDKHT